MSSYILCIFEGRKTEQNIANNLCKYLLNEHGKVTLRASYGFNLYQLYEEIAKDEYFNTYQIIVDQLEARKHQLRPEEQYVLNIKDADKISDIYLFFDYDCHCSNANDNKLSAMLETFNDPQDKGLLCVSYPMVEAIRHQKGAEYQEELYSIDQLKNYKKWVSNNQEFSNKYANWGLYDKSIWSDISLQHLARANLLINDKLSFPDCQLPQELIFDNQRRKHIPKGSIAVISAFPLMLFDYYGQRLIEKLKE